MGSSRDTFPVDTGDYCISMMQFPFAFFTPPKTTAIPHFCLQQVFITLVLFIHFYDAILASLYSLLRSTLETAREMLFLNTNL